MLHQRELSGLLSGMSYFGNRLDLMLSRKKMSAADLARNTGIGPPMISRYRSGDVVSISPDALANIAGAISEDPAEQAELIAAYLKDQCPPSIIGQIEITIAGQNMLKEQGTVYAEPVSKEGEEAFAVLRRHFIHDKDIREIIVGLANLLSKGTSQFE